MFSISVTVSHISESRKPMKGMRRLLAIPRPIVVSTRRLQPDSDLDSTSPLLDRDDSMKPKIVEARTHSFESSLLRNEMIPGVLLTRSPLQ